MLTKEEYLAKKGSVCPQCGATVISALDDIDIRVDIGYQNMECEVCKFKWVDYWRLVDYEPNP